MQEKFHFTTDRAKIQKQYAAIFFFVSAQLSLIQTHLQLLERSRSNRRCRALRLAIQWIRHERAKRGQHHAYAAVDSMPIELCHAARMYRVKRFQGIADIGLCASKKQWYDGLKLHLQVTDQGLPVGYVVTEASCHDRIAAETVMTPIPHPYNLGEKGFVSNDLQRKLYEEYEIAFWTPSRKNQKHRPSASWERWLQQKRKVVETVFSVLVDPHRITDIRAHSIVGFEVALDGIPSELRRMYRGTDRFFDTSKLL